ncbi:hypothetical protein ASPBRDRAFT_247890 [Aspergillus brasiliensis CBS 101740]|uniref:Uncharacterized protein n=1 Tax=Aspergillus brasiliensis (strain CBS 101740 / IMI 381727 / IBT 21946) TaxID=767769 RepID=A0A1L9V1Q9_ASPBC|nr:hypothetical protein ASPBRDRAFT_247890 [Aspergillus brasiliensis CBS 101740]
MSKETNRWRYAYLILDNVIFIIPSVTYGVLIKRRNERNQSLTMQTKKTRTIVPNQDNIANIVCIYRVNYPRISSSVPEYRTCISYSGE